MFFTLSKVFWALAQPLSLTALLIAGGLLALLLSWRRTASLFMAGALTILFLAGFTSLGHVLLIPLEQRFRQPDPPPADITGVVVLGGAFRGAINMARGGYELNSAGDRMVEAAILARRYPAARIIISGGSGALLLDGEGDADAAPRLLEALGVSRERMTLENQSRNTHENAAFTRDLAEPRPGDSWLLVTSAFHMPRSYDLFRKAGFDVIPWPVDYRTRGDETLALFGDNPMDSLQNLTLAIREWIGLIAYRATGRTDSLLPGPAPEIPLRTGAG